MRIHRFLDEIPNARIVFRCYVCKIPPHFLKEHPDEVCVSTTAGSTISPNGTPWPTGHSKSEDTRASPRRLAAQDVRSAVPLCHARPPQRLRLQHHRLLRRRRPTGVVCGATSTITATRWTSRRPPRGTAASWSSRSVPNITGGDTIGPGMTGSTCSEGYSKVYPNLIKHDPRYPTPGTAIFHADGASKRSGTPTTPLQTGKRSTAQARLGMFTGWQIIRPQGERTGYEKRTGYEIKYLYRSVR